MTKQFLTVFNQYCENKRALMRVAVIVLLSLLVAIFVFTLNKYKYATLVIQAKTLEKGKRYIFVEEKDSNSVSRLGYETGSTTGEDSIYPIELPRIKPQSIKIPPLASLGKYEISRITLSSDSISYRWDQALVCSQQMLKNGILTNEICGNNSPVVSVDQKSNILISSIPDTGAENRFWVRIVIAITAATAMFLSCTYLSQPTDETILMRRLIAVAARASWLLVIILFLFQLAVIWSNAVDIPYYEEWEFFELSALPKGLSWQWLSHPISFQRMMLFTKFMAWVHYKLFSLDFIKLKVFNYTVFGGLIVALVRFKHMIVGRDFRFFPLFVAYLMSTIVYEVHIASFQSGETFVVMLSLVMLCHIIQAEPTCKAALIFSICSVLAMYSLSAGFVYTIVLLIMGTFFTVVRIYRNNISRSSGLRFIMLLWSLVTPNLAIWIYGYNKPDAIWGAPEWLLPVGIKFWTVYLDLLSFGFGFETDHLAFGLVCLIVVIAPILLLLKDTTQRWEVTTWQVTTAIIGTLAIIGLLVVGRGNMPFSIKVSRYAIFCYLLIPYTSIAWWLALKTSKLRSIFLTLFWCFCATAYMDDWEYGVYNYVKQIELQNMECVGKYNENGGDGLCPGTFIFPIGVLFDNAKKIDANFTRQFELKRLQK